MTYASAAAKALRVHGNMAARLRRAVDEYASDQTMHANNVKQLAGSEAKRLRVADYRVVLQETATEILVTKIAPRGRAYWGREDDG